MRFRRLLATALGAGLLAAPASAQVTDQAFRGGSTGDLAALCGATAADPMHTAALNWCHGFIVGAGQYHHSMTDAGAGPKALFCLPNPEPTLEQARLAFVAWAKSHPHHAAERAVDGLSRFAAETWPCPPARIGRPAKR
ncbi:Rap1a/Tai family immunity protein [Dankookia sp. GCM10030260]|uniref:Rap1a/Tai family immunity protein n=1 Tax=Dankookia sp. GCM10030260 TaxID=3273390 RepID=UPI00360A0C15